MRTIWCAEGLFEPSSGLIAYLERWPATEANPVRIMTGVRRAPLPEAVTKNEHVRLASVLPGRGLGRLPVEHVRSSYWEVCASILNGGLPVDAVIVCATSMGSHFDLGVIDGYLQLLIDAAEVVVVEEVVDLPLMRGAAKVHRADMVVTAGAAGEHIPLSGEPDAVSKAIARNACQAIGGGVRSLALGVGRVADAIAEIFEPPRELSVVTGAITDNTRTLAQRGVLSKAAPIRAMSVVASPDATSWAAMDDRIRLLPSTIIHSPSWLAQQRGFTVVLGGLQIDLRGNVNAERIGERQVSGLGGAPDFAAGAQAAPEGRVVIAMSARSPTGTSNLVERVSATTVQGSFVDAVATEFGIATRDGSDSQWLDDLERIFPAVKR